MSEGGFVLLWARAFALTLCLELAVAVPTLRSVTGSLPRRLAIVTLAQLATHPLLWFVLPALHLPRAAFLAVGELGALFLEAVAYRAALPSCSTQRALVVSLLANTASFLAGLAV